MRVHTVPFGHPLAPSSHSFARPELEDVVRRLQELFQRLSMCVEYSDGDETRSAEAVCTTLQNVGFVVVFWAANTSSYTVEVQHTKGSSSQFCADARGVLEAVKGSERYMELESCDPLNVDLACAKKEQRCMETLFARGVADRLQKGYPSVQEDIRNAMDRVADMFAMERYDCRNTALQSLEAMTDVRRSGLAVGTAAAAAVLDGESIISKTIASLVGSLLDANSVLKDQEFTALTILGQSVNLADSEALGSYVHSHPEVVQVLLSGAVQQNAHIAYISVHMLAVLHSHVSSEVSSLPLDRIQLAGMSHAALMHASERLTESIDGQS